MKSKGCIAFAHRVDLDAGLNDRSTAIVIAVPTSVATRSMVEVAASARCTARAAVMSTEATGFRRFKWMRRISVSYECRGSQLIQWLADNAPSVGEVKACWGYLSRSPYDIRY